MHEITHILNAIEQGDERVVDKLLPAVYDELRRLAAWKLSQERPGQTLQATALVHEAYIRLVGSEAQSWKSRTHFFSAAAEAMRRILIENARRKQRIKHGGGQQKIDFEDATMAIEEPSENLMALDETLAKLENIDKVKAELVKLRYFSGLTAQQTAEVLGISHNTADKYWAYARAWLQLEIAKNKEQTRH